MTICAINTHLKIGENDNVVHTNNNSNDWRSNDNNTSDRENDSNSMHITNYDVLIDGGKETAFQLVDTEHVGNKRFEVFLNLHKEEYQKASEAHEQEEMDRIVGKIVDIVCNKCIPNGRFLEKVAIPIEGESEWMDIGKGELARRRLHQALNGAGGNKMPARSSKVFTKQEQKTDAANSKRRRRGSYARLRRSISESMIFHSTLERVNKTSTNGLGGGGGHHHNNHNHENSAWAELTIPDPSRSNMETPTSLFNATNEMTTLQQVQMKPMDVIVNSNRNSLASTGNPGNARFGILISMHADNFAAAAGNNDSRREILEELMTAVQTHWKGRFLVTTIMGSYELLPKEAISASISGLLLKEGNAASADHAVDILDPLPVPPQHIMCTPSTSLNALPYRNTSKRTLLDHQQSTMSDISTGSTTASIPDRLLSHSGTLEQSLTRGLTRLSFTNAGPTSAATASSIAAAAIASEPSTTDKMRNAAVESLKAKKKKRDLMRRVMGRNK